MTPELSTHPSQEALDDVLIGMGSAESAAHLARCGECRARVEQFRADVELFNVTSMAWSESRPSQALDPARRIPTRRMPFALVGSAAAAGLAIVMALSVGHHQRQTSGDKRVNDVAVVEDSQAQIVQDNELMEAVNAAIGPQDESIMDEYGISENHSKYVKARPK